MPSIKRSQATQWDAALDGVGVSKAALDSIVMDYLIVEGHKTAAQQLAKDANMDLTLSMDSINHRHEIRALIHSGKIEGAISHINEASPELLERNEDLHFDLLRLQLIEMIRDANDQNLSSENFPYKQILEFAASNLAQKATKNRLDDLEETMALLCFQPSELVPRLQALLDLKLRRSVAASVNEVLLKQQKFDGEAKIKGLIKLWGWAEHQCTKEKVNFRKLDESDLS